MQRLPRHGQKPGLRPPAGTDDETVNPVEFRFVFADHAAMETLSRRQFAAFGSLAFAGRSFGQLPAQKFDNLGLPASAVTSGPKHHWFGYYDKCPWDATGRYLLAHEADFCDRQPAATDSITVGMVDLKDKNRFVPLDSTKAWSWQQGAMLQWLGPKADREVIYNSVSEGRFRSVVRDVHSGKARTLPMPVYAVSLDGTKSLCPDFARTHRLRPGYGYASVPESKGEVPAPDDMGIYFQDLVTGANRLILSLKQIATNKPDARFDGAHHGVEHLVWNPAATRFVFLHRWRVGTRQWLTRVYTAKPDGTDLKLHLDTGMASHFDWKDDHTLLFWAKHPTAGNCFFTIDVRTDETAFVGRDVLTQDGHCSYSPDRKWLLNDTYPDKDRMQTLMLYHLATGRRIDLNRFHSPKTFTGPTRCDLHPRWSRDGTQVCFDGCHEPQRQVYVVNVKDVVNR
jgi:hypothetical protein